MSNLTVWAIWEGEILTARNFTSETLAEAYYSSTVDKYNRSDDSEGVTVQLIDNRTNDVLLERHFA